MTGILTKTRTVMKHIPSLDEDAKNCVTFIVADDDGLIIRTVILDYQDYIDLGAPQQITVTIEPEDTLNLR